MNNSTGTTIRTPHDQLRIFSQLFVTLQANLTSCTMPYMKQNASARQHKRQLLARAASFGARHKIITALSVCIIVLASTIGWLWYANYSQKFSKEDFDQLTTMAKGVLEK